MKRVLFLAVVALMAQPALADTQVRGHYRKDGTYVQPHVRSSPNSSAYDNYGRQSGSPSYSSPYMRDQDHDGMSNRFDMDDDNDGTFDDFEQ